MVAGEGQAPHIYFKAKNTKISEDYEISYVIDIDYIGIQQTKNKSENRDSERISGQQMK